MSILLAPWNKVSQLYFKCILYHYSIQSYIIYKLIDYLDSPDTSLKHGLILVACLVLAVASKILFNNFNWYICARAASRMRSALLLIVYGKIVRVRANADITTGEVKF